MRQNEEKDTTIFKIQIISELYFRDCLSVLRGRHIETLLEGALQGAGSPEAELCGYR